MQPALRVQTVQNQPRKTNRYEVRIHNWHENDRPIHGWCVWDTQGVYKHCVVYKSEFRMAAEDEKARRNRADL